LTINLLNNLLKYSDFIKSKKHPPSPEDIIKWFLDDLTRETELAINVTKGIHFQAALSLINNAYSKFPQNNEQVINSLRESLTKITTEASYAYSKL